jgi:eukaryotic-like serine/threonine-protein kinase
MSHLGLSSEVDDLLLAFENAASATRVPDVEPFLPPPGDPIRPEAVRELARVALELRWARGERPDPAEYLARFPELADSDALADLAFEDYRQRVLAGDRPSRESYRRRFGVDVADWPGPEAATAKLGPTEFDAPIPISNAPTEHLRPEPAEQRELQPIGRPFPEAGDLFAGFRLIRELGRGAFGRVFLAEQIDLAGRRVALKISPRLAGEVRTLARLQHTNIVPIYSTHRAPPFTALCMPFFGATTLAAVLSDLAGEQRPASARVIVDSIHRRQLRTPAECEKAVAAIDSSAIAFLQSACYIDAVLWIGERLADALAHAHERGIVHRDIKPANVLIGDDGQPMLLDFNLAADGNDSTAERARVGGTLPYMASEQVRAFGGGTEAVDGRADVYSLGAVLFQLLTGRLPYPDHYGETQLVLTRMSADRSGPVPLLRRHNLQVTPAVESIVRKCLASNPADRYPSAAALRDDLARQRAHLPLKFAAERSLRERAGKWIRRHPLLVSPAALIAYAAAILLAASAITVWLSLSARAQRQDAERAAAYRQYEKFLSLADRAKLAAGARERSNEAYEIGNEALGRYGATEPGWDTQDVVMRLPANERERLKLAIGEIAFVTARAASNLRRDEALAAKLNAVAKDALGNDATASGLDPDAIASALNGGNSDFLRACDLAALGRHRNALPIVNKFVARQPEDFGGWYLKARCHAAIGQYEDARAAYSTCAALRPLSAVPIAERGELAFRQLKDLEQARADLDRALQLDPNVKNGRLTRALVLRSLRKFSEALADLDELAKDERAPTRVYFVRAQVREAMGDKAGAAADRDEGMKRAPTDPPSFVTRGLFQAAKEPEKALADFRAAEELDPFYADALVNQAWLLGEKMNRPDEAIAVTDRLLKLYPDNMNGRAGRAVLLARIGKTEEAIAEARRCVAAAPHASAYYQAGCVFAVVSAKDPKYREEGIRLIATALLRGFGHEYLLNDDDLKPLRDDDRFRKLLDGVKVMKDLGKH